MDKDNQKLRILAYMEKNGSITRKQAMDDLGIWNITARISELRGDGFSIVTVTKEGKNRFGDRTQYGEYHLAKKQPPIGTTALRKEHTT